MMTLDLEPANEADLDEVESLLDQNDLPTADLHANEIRLFCARADGELVGVGGLEVYGPDALLRSVVTDPSVRGEGYGTSLVDALEERAAALGATELYLLTTTAATFFGDLDYREVDRESAPRSIRETTQFSTLCPDSATCMRKRVE